MCISMLIILFTEKLELWADVACVVLPFINLCPSLLYPLTFCPPWVPRGVTCRSFAGGCCKWKFSAHSVSFVSWEKWRVCQEPFWEEVSAERPLPTSHSRFPMDWACLGSLCCVSSIGLAATTKMSITLALPLGSLRDVCSIFRLLDTKETHQCAAQ